MIVQTSIEQLKDEVRRGSYRNLAKVLSAIENGEDWASPLLHQVDHSAGRVLGITGPPGAGKSTLVNCLIDTWASKGQFIAVLAVDPSSPFTSGSLLGDRIRMSAHYAKPNVYIRSLATRGVLGGLSARTFELADILRSSGFDYVLIETVGVGQSEVEISAIADSTTVVLVPESGDDIQAIKSGLVEIADTFVVNKADRDGAGKFAQNLRKTLADQGREESVFLTEANTAQGITELAIHLDNLSPKNNERRAYLLARKVWAIVENRRMQDIDASEIQRMVLENYQNPSFNVYRLAESLV